MFLPVFAFMLLLFGNIALFHHDDGSRRQGLHVIRLSATGQDSIAHLQVRELEGNGVFQIFLSRCNAQDAGGILNRDFDVRAGIRFYRDRVSLNGLHGTHLPGHNRLRGRIRLRLGEASRA